MSADKSQTKINPSDKTETKAKTAAAKAKTKAADKPKAEPKAKASAKPKAEPKAKATAKPKAEPKAKTAAKPKVEPKVRAAAKPKVEPKVRAAAKPKAEPKVKAAAKSKVEPKTRAAVKPKARAAARKTPARDLAELVAAAAAEHKPLDPVLLDLRGMSSVADWFFIASAENPRQMSAIADKIVRRAREHGFRPLGREGQGRSDERWVLLDLGEVVVHLFNLEGRELYDLDGLWTDAPRRDLK